MVFVSPSDITYSPYVCYDMLEFIPRVKQSVPVKCPKCNNIKNVVLRSHLQTIRRNNGKYLCHLCSIDRKICSDNARKLWSNPESSRKILDHLQSDEMRDIVRQKNKRLFADEEWVNEWRKSINTELISARSKEMWSNPEFRRKISRSFSERCKKQWRDPKYRDKIMAYRSTDSYKIKMLEVRKKMALTKSSKQQLILYQLLDDMGVKFEKEYPVGYYLFDCFIPKQFNMNNDLLIEIQGDYWHSLPKSERNDKSKATYVTKYFQDMQIKYLWEHEFIAKDRITNVIKYWLGIHDKLEEINFSDVKMSIIDHKIAENFMGMYHYSGKLGRSGINLGFYHDDILVAVIVYSNSTRLQTSHRLNLDHNELLELSRLAIHPRYQIKNLASYLISKSINYIRKNKQNIKCLVSFADSTFNHLGTIYKASNWILDGIVNPSYWYVDKDKYVCHKKTLWDRAKSMKMSEDEYAIKYGYYKVIGKEKSRFIYKL